MQMRRRKETKHRREREPTPPMPDAPRSPTTPVRTPPLADEPRATYFDGPDPVIALREYDGASEWDLPRKASVTLGASSSCDIAIPGRGLSATHCTVERRALRCRVYDMDSTHGLIFGGRRVATADINPGDTFTPMPITLLALNKE